MVIDVILENPKTSAVLGIGGLIGIGIYKGSMMAHGLSDNLLTDPLMYVPAAGGGLLGGAYGFAASVANREDFNSLIAVPAGGLLGAGVVTAIEGLGVCIGYTLTKIGQ